MIIADLPEFIITEIFKYLALSTLLQSVNRTCRKFYKIVKNTSILWRNFEFDTPLFLTTTTVKDIFRHSPCFRRFLLTTESISCSTAFLDLTFVQGFHKAYHLTWLDLTDSKLSTLCFLTYTLNLEILNLSGCRNLVDDDFRVITNCSKLDQLYVSFTAISPGVIVEISEKLDLISLDACAVHFTLIECKSCSKSTVSNVFQPLC